MNLVALDLSLTATGWAKSDGSSGVLEPKKLSGMLRLAWILDRIVDLTIGADVIAIEGLAYGAKGNAMLDLAGLGTLVRFTLFELKRVTVDVPTQCAKMFATGHGNAKKEDVLVAAVKKLGYEGSNNNVSDALWILELARARYDGRELTAKQKQALSGVQWPLLTPADPTREAERISLSWIQRSET